MTGLAVLLAAAALTGQSPDCERFCMSVTPSEGTVGETVFRFRGRGWRPNRRVEIFYGPYCQPGAACPAIAFMVRLRTNERGRFVFRFRVGPVKEGDDEQDVHAGGGEPVFEQLVGRPRHTRWLRRQPHFTANEPSG